MSTYIAVVVTANLALTAGIGVYLMPYSRR